MKTMFLLALLGLVSSARVFCLAPKTCGLTGTARDRINDCKEKFGEVATIKLEHYGHLSETFVWRLFARTEAMEELWYDTANAILWSAESIDKYFYPGDRPADGKRLSDKCSDRETDIDRAGYFSDKDGHGKEIRISWELPTARDYSSAAKAGITKVLLTLLERNGVWARLVDDRIVAFGFPPEVTAYSALKIYCIVKFAKSR